MGREFEQQYDLESVDPELEALLTDDEAAGSGEEFWCLFDIGAVNGSTSPYSELSGILEDAGYAGASRKGRMNMASARLDREGIEIALQQPYVTSARLDRNRKTGNF